MKLIAPPSSGLLSRVEDDGEVAIGGDDTLHAFGGTGVVRYSELEADGFDNEFEVKFNAAAPPGKWFSAVYFGSFGEVWAGRLNGAIIGSLFYEQQPDVPVPVWLRRGARRRARPAGACAPRRGRAPRPRPRWGARGAPRGPGVAPRPAPPRPRLSARAPAIRESRKTERTAARTGWCAARSV